MPQKDCFRESWKKDKNMVMISLLQLQNSKPLKLKYLSYSLLKLKYLSYSLFMHTSKQRTISGFKILSTSTDMINQLLIISSQSEHSRRKQSDNGWANTKK